MSALLKEKGPEVDEVDLVKEHIWHIKTKKRSVFS
jgi:hypothetical protein